MKRVKAADLCNFKPWYNFINTTLTGTSLPYKFDQRIEFINEQLKPYHAVWDIRVNPDSRIDTLDMLGSDDLIFETEEAYTWFVLKWS
jgi:hypothetical protein